MPRWQTHADLSLPSNVTLTALTRTQFEFRLQRRKKPMPKALLEASKYLSGYEEKTAGDDGVRGEGAGALASMHDLRSAHRAR